MTTTPPLPTGRRDSAISLAIRLGLLWQAAFSVAMLRHYLVHGSSFYLDNIAGAWPYVHQHLLWIGAFIGLSTGRRGIARALAGGAAFLAVVQVVSFAHGGAMTSEVLNAGGVACFGVLPAIALLMPGVQSAFHRRLDWLSSGLMVAIVLALFDDGVLPPGGMRTGVVQSGGVWMGVSELNGVVRAVWVGWVACILALAWHGRGDRRSRLAALASTGHLLVVQLVWFWSDMVALLDIPDSLPRPPLPVASVLRVVLLATVLVALAAMVGHPAKGRTGGTARGYGMGPR